MRRHLYVAAIATGLPWAAVANAQPGNDAARADASFNEAMQLRSAGRDLEACPKFAESQRLAPGVGVTLYLADCYERTGRTASAWQEFRAGEKLARRRRRATCRRARTEAQPPHGRSPCRDVGCGRAARRKALAGGILERGSRG